MRRGTRAIALVVTVGALAFVASPAAPESELPTAGADRAAEPWFDPRPVTVSGTYERQLVGDWNGDGYDDIVWYGPGSARDGLWFGNPGGFTHRPLTISRTYQDILVGDYDGDGRDDLLFYAPGSATDGVWLGRADGTFTHKRITVNGSYDAVIVGDYSGDGRDDVIWYGAGSAGDSLWLGRSGASFVPRPLAVQGVYVAPVSGAFDDDAHDDILWDDRLWYGADDGHFVYYAGRGTSTTPVRNPTTFRLVGDFNGDGRDDIAQQDGGWLADPRGGFTPWYTSPTDPEVPTPCNLASPDGHIGDFNGDGLDDLFWYTDSEISDQYWESRLTDDHLDSKCHRLFIEGSYTPFVLDFDGDGDDDVFHYGPGAAHDSLWAGD